METNLLPANEDPRVQEALSLRYVDRIGLAWLPDAQIWAIYANNGKLAALAPALVEQDLREVCEAQDRDWKRRYDEAQLERTPGPSVSNKAAEDLDL